MPSSLMKEQKTALPPNETCHMDFKGLFGKFSILLGSKR
jgi:hypothetical protein